MEQESKENSNLAKAIERLQFEAHDIAPSLHGRLDKLLKEGNNFIYSVE